MMLELLLIGGGYLFGSVSSAIITCRVLGLPDPRSQGSGNPGATNVLRIGGKKAAAVTLVGDMLKGLLPVLAASLLNVAPLTLALTGLAAFLGHLYPVFFGFRGGKGVATALGGFVVLAPIATVTSAAVFLVLVVWKRYISLGSVAAVGGYVLGRLLGKVILQAFLDEMTESRSRQNEATDGTTE